MADVLNHLSFGTDAAEAVSTADLVIEAIIENLDIKRELFAALDKAAPQYVALPLPPLCTEWERKVQRNIDI